MDGIIITFLLFLLIATLYSSVGHAGASGYLAIMALLSFAPESIKPTSLILNVLVASIASYKFIGKGFFDKKIFLPVVLASVPTAFLGGYISLDPKVFKLLAGLFLLLSATMLVVKTYVLERGTQSKPRNMPLGVGLFTGALIGLFSGLIGVGGGIFLSPILILTNWTQVKNASGIAALFILFNSISGLAGHVTALKTLDYDILYWIIAVGIGGLIGSNIGSSRVNNKFIVGLLFIVLISAGIKFVFVDFAAS